MDTNTIVVVTKTNPIALWTPVFIAIGSLTAACTAVYMAIRTEKRAEASNQRATTTEERAQKIVQVDILIRLLNQFESHRMLAVRKRTAESLLVAKTTQRANLPPEANGYDPEAYRDIEDVLDFFETVALFVKRGIVDNEIVWHTFYYWMHGYHEASKEHLSKIRSRDTTWYSDFFALHDQLKIIEAKDKMVNADNPDSWTTEMTVRFLSGEASLLPNVAIR